MLGKFAKKNYNGSIMQPIQFRLVCILNLKLKNKKFENQDFKRK